AKPGAPPGRPTAGGCYWRLLFVVFVVAALGVAGGGGLEVQLAVGEHLVQDLLHRTTVAVAPQLLPLELLEGPVDPLIVVVASHVDLLVRRRWVAGWG